MHEVVEDPRLSWPAAFIEELRCVVLETTGQFLETVYGQ
jgi:hypothetical protein